MAVIISQNKTMTPRGWNIKLSAQCQCKRLLMLRVSPQAGQGKLNSHNEGQAEKPSPYGDMIAKSNRVTIEGSRNVRECD